jgi:hypothetical protein
MSARNHPSLCFLQLRIVTGVLQSGSLKGNAHHVEEEF